MLCIGKRQVDINFKLVSFFWFSLPLARLYNHAIIRWFVEGRSILLHRGNNLAVFSTSFWNALQYICQWKGQKCYLKILQKCWIEQIEKILSKMAPNHGFQIWSISTRKYPAHTSAIVTFFYFVLANREGQGNRFRTPFIFTTPCLLWLFFPNWKPSLLHSNIGPQALWSAVCQCLTSIPKSAYRDAFREWIHRLK